MFFEKEILSFNILDVLEFNQTNVNMYNSGRNFNALSFRFRSDARLTVRGEELHMQDNYVSYFPARLDYGRTASVDRLIVIHFDTTNYHTQNIEFFEAKDPERFAELFRKILECWNKREVAYKYRCSALLYEIFAECYAQNYHSEMQQSKIGHSVEYIMQNYKKSDRLG